MILRRRPPARHLLNPNPATPPTPDDEPPLTDRRTVQTVALGLVIIVIVATVGALLLVLRVIDSDPVSNQSLMILVVVLSNIAVGGLCGLAALLASTKSVDPEAISDRARTDALAEVEALGPNLLGQGD